MRNPTRYFRFCAALALALVGAQADAQTSAQVVRANGVELHYIEKGAGVPVIFVHGGLEDYRAWGDQVEAFSGRYHAVAYSRRYNFPNVGAGVAGDYSPVVDAEDLAALIRRLKLAPAHVIGYSYGAYAALFLAQRHPELVRSLVLAEPPALPLLPRIAGGEALRTEFMAKVWQPAVAGFRESDEAGVRAGVNGFGEIGYSGTDEKMTFDSLPPDVRAVVLDNAPEWRALTRSKNAFPSLPISAIERIRTPTLLMGGARSLPLAHAIDGLLERSLPHARRVVIADATHDMWSEHPEECRDAALRFLKLH
jgi:pimeloyl-ACP methyl ester carboxylesterase